MKTDTFVQSLRHVLMSVAELISERRSHRHFATDAVSSVIGRCTDTTHSVIISCYILSHRMSSYRETARRSHLKMLLVLSRVAVDMDIHG